LVLAGAGSGKTSVLVARAGWLLTTGEAVADQILLLAFGRKAAQEMDERIQARLHTQDISARTFHSLVYTSFNRAAKKFLLSASWRTTLRLARRCLSRHGVSSAVKKGAGERLASVAEEELTGRCRRAASGRMKSWRAGWALVSTGG
jgi:thymidylate kinase